MSRRTKITCSISTLLTATALMAAAAGWTQQAPLGVAPVLLDRDSYTFDTAEQHGIRVDVVVRGLNHPFSLSFLPNGDALVSERGAALRLIRSAIGDARLEPAPIGGTPPTAEFRGGGLHEVAIGPSYANDGLVYFTHNAQAPAAADAEPGTPPPVSVVLSRGRFDGSALVNVEEVFRGEPRAGSSGSRLAFANGLIYMTTGAPFGPEAQDLGSVYGKVLRLTTDGSAAAGNPFAGRADARPEIFTLGHRDQLGLTVHAPTGTVLAAEHGPNGGDEVNLLLPGRNYGWPDYSFGRTYEGPRWSARPLGEETEQPLVLWIPSIAPTGMTFYMSDRIPAWRGNLFVGSARRGEIPRTGGLERVVLNDDLEELRRESLLTDLHQRIRDVREGPDGLLYAITDEDDGALLRISPSPHPD